MWSFKNNRKKKHRNLINESLKNNISNIRKKVKILIIDDNEFGIVDTLTKRGYQVYYKKDVDYPLEAEPYDIIVTDIKGVARNFGTHGGFSYAIEIKKIYPFKLVICYSGTTTDPSINEDLNKLDGFIKKDTDIDSWCDKLDNYIEKYIDIDRHWDITKDLLKKQNISDSTIANIKDTYYSAYRNTDLNSLRDKLMEELRDIDLVFNVIGRIVTFSKFFIA